MKLRKPVIGWSYFNKGGLIMSSKTKINDLEILCRIVPCYPDTDENGWIETAKRKPTNRDVNHGFIAYDGNSDEYSIFKKGDKLKGFYVCGGFTHWKLLKQPKLPKKEKKP